MNGYRFSYDNMSVTTDGGKHYLIQGASDSLLLCPNSGKVHTYSIAPGIAKEVYDAAAGQTRDQFIQFIDTISPGAKDVIVEGR